MALRKASRAVKLFGTEVPDGKRRELKAGDLTAMLDNGSLRYIRYRGVEVLRGIAYLLRDKNWGTYAPAIENLKIRQTKTSFTVSYRATCRDAEQALSYEAAIIGKADGTLSFSAVGTPIADFVTNRTGFVVLHPLVGVASQPVEIVHVDGKRERSRFPKLISPGQPVFEIRSLKHTVMPGVTATVLMEGNKFEMEDHRNWMDASYKTYVCSLLDPWPYTLPKGKPFTQSITLTIAGKPKARSASRNSVGIAVTVGGPKGKLPSLGMGVAMGEAKAALAAAHLIAAAKPAFLVCQIDGRNLGNAGEAARNYAELKIRTSAAINLEIILPAERAAVEEVEAIATVVRAAGLKPDSVIVTQTHDLKSFQPGATRPWSPTYAEMASAVRKSFPGIRVGGGMLSYFTELNRKPVPAGLFDFVTHTTCPIVHAADDLSVMETLEALSWIFTSVRAMIGKTPYHIGPSSIPARDNPYGSSVAGNADNSRVCLSNMDPRQRGLFAAAWNLGYAVAATRDRIDALALGSATGPQGIIYRKTDYAQPWFDQAGAGVYPAYHVLAGLGAARQAKALSVESAIPSQIAALAFADKDNTTLWLANLTGEKKTVKVAGIKGAITLHLMNDANFETLATQPDFLATKGKALRKVGAVELGPYAVARIMKAK